MSSCHYNNVTWKDRQNTLMTWLWCERIVYRVIIVVEFFVMTTTRKACSILRIVLHYAPKSFFRIIGVRESRVVSLILRLLLSLLFQLRNQVDKLDVLGKGLRYSYFFSWDFLCHFYCNWGIFIDHIFILSWRETIYSDLLCSLFTFFCRCIFFD